MKKEVEKHFQTNDPLLFAWLEKIGPIDDLQGDVPSNYFFRLCKEIVKQQLSDKAGHAIFTRFKNVFPKGAIRPENVLAVSHQTLRDSGISHAKARYVRNLAEAVVGGDLDFKKFRKLDNEQVVEKLIQVKGIGRWTAEMFLMFTLGREDVFSHGDLGLRKGIMKVYRLRKEPTKERIEKIVSRWSPYKTYGCRILWGAISLK
ncbi:MAG: DNA-3-methyladenine glycosylase 2 family protein [Candidatus Pacebacteria bacterium]|nr:DNA-3-methyladenine glycosylase 2 family protein [Candidatus Paceibacterota bacterium]